MFLRSFSAILITSGLLSVSAQSQAQDPADVPTTNQWVSQKIVKTYGRRFSDKRRAENDSGEVLYTSSTTQPGIYFSCVDKKFRVGFTYEAQSVPLAFSNIAISGVSGGGNFVPTSESLANVSAQFNGQPRVILGRWLYSKNTPATLSRDNKAAQKIYNAVVRGQSIKATIRSQHEFTLLPPKVSDSFADFGAACGIGRLRAR